MSHASEGRHLTSRRSRLPPLKKEVFIMDVNTITSLISNLGFPIAACCYMAWNNYQSGKRHREETAALTAAIDNNTLVITELKTKMDLIIKEEK